MNTRQALDWAACLAQFLPFLFQENVMSWKSGDFEHRVRGEMEGDVLSLLQKVQITG